MEGKIKFFKYLLVFFVVLAIFGFSSDRAKADGGAFYPPGYYVSETGQKALIYYQNQTENLVVSTSFQGNSQDFAWVIPTPSKPEVFKSSNSLFTTLTKITRTNDYTSSVYDTMPTLGTKSESSVQVIEEKTIDIYDTAILKATDDKALAQWLQDHGYTFPQNKSYMLQDYINNNWYFVIAKIQNALIQDSDIKTQLSTGTITPLRLQFQSSKIIYPMKLTRLAHDYAKENNPDKTTSEARLDQYFPEMQINLYVLTDSKTTQNQLETNWANWINSKDIANLNNSVTEEDWIKGNKLFLTKMGSSINIQNVDNDFIITKADNNSVYPVPVYKTFNFWLWNFLSLFLTVLIAVFSPLGLLFIIAIIFQMLVTKKRWLYIVGNIYQVIACLVVITFSAVLLIAGSQNSKNFSAMFLESGVIGITIGLLMLLVAGIFFTVKMIKKYKNVYSTNKNPQQI